MIFHGLPNFGNVAEFCGHISETLLNSTVTSTWPHLNSDVALQEGEY